MRDPYDILGVSKTADDQAIKSAYRKLARQNHPDLHPNDKAAEERFKEIQGAYDLLQDKDKRAAFDGGTMEADGTPKQTHGYYRTWAEGAPGSRYHDPGEVFGQFDADDIFADLFRSAGGGGGSAHRRGADARYGLDVDFLDAVKGGVKHLTLPDGKHLKVTIPEGSEDGQVLRLRGQGAAAAQGGESGDALIELRIKPHPSFRRQGHDILLELPITLYEAVLGAKIEIPTIDGPVAMTVPKGSNTGSRLRLKGKGVPVRGGNRGDQYVTLRVILPDQPDPALERWVAEWAESHPYDVRAKESTR